MSADILHPRLVFHEYSHSSIPGKLARKKHTKTHNKSALKPSNGLQIDYEELLRLRVAHWANAFSPISTPTALAALEYHIILMCTSPFNLRIFTLPAHAFQWTYETTRDIFVQWLGRHLHIVSPTYHTVLIFSDIRHYSQT